MVSKIKEKLGHFCTTSQRSGNQVNHISYGVCVCVCDFCLFLWSEGLPKQIIYVTSKHSTININVIETTVLNTKIRRLFLGAR